LKILLGSSLYEPYGVGGAEKVVRALAAALTVAGHEVAVITTQPQGAAEQRRIGDVTIHYVPVRNLYRPFGDSKPGGVSKALWRIIDSYNPLMTGPLESIISREAPDVVNTHNVAGLSVSLWGAARRRGIPIVHTMHDQYLLCHRSTMFKNGHNCARQCIDCRFLGAPRKRMSDRVDVAVGVSQFILDRHKLYGYFNSAESTVIYNPTLNDNPNLNETGHAVGQPRDSDTVRLGFLGQIIPTKGLHELLAAFLRLGSIQAELWIGGRLDSSYASELQRQTASNPAVRWLGFVNPLDFFNDIDVLVVPSLWHDTAPLVILEAFNQGVPVLGSNRGGIPEFIDLNTGWLFDPGVPGALQRMLIECVQSTSKFKSMGQACITKARQLDTRTWAKDYLRAYQRALAHHEATKPSSVGDA